MKARAGRRSHSSLIGVGVSLKASVNSGSSVPKDTNTAVSAAEEGRHPRKQMSKQPEKDFESRIFRIIRDKRGHSIHGTLIGSCEIKMTYMKRN